MIPLRTAAVLMLLVAMTACGGHAEGPHDDHAHEHDHGAAAEDEFERGPHGGRMLRDGAIAVELAIFEQGVPPQFRAWVYRDGELLEPGAGSLEVTLRRLGGRTDTHTFRSQGEYLVGSEEVYEPHSFDVEVDAQIDGRTLRWSYPSYEGRTEIDAAIAEAAGLRTALAGPGLIRDEHEVQGLITTVEGRHARIVARFPGSIEAVPVGIGDQVRAGQTLAVIESNTSLSDYAVKSPFDGTVIARQATVGELAGDMPLLEIADLSQLWVDVHLFGADAQHIRAGVPVVVTRLTDGARIETEIDRVLPATATQSQSTVARATIPNSDGDWRPGAAVKALVTVAVDEVGLRVPVAALQRFRDWDVVFVRIGDTYEARPVELGRRDASYVEIVEGLEPGAEIVVAQSFLVKADIEKSGASHDH